MKCKKIFLCMLAIIMLLGGCKEKQNAENPKNSESGESKEAEVQMVSDEQKIEEIVCNFAEKFFQMELHDILPMCKSGSDAHNMMKRGQPENAGKVMENFIAEYEKYGGNVADIDESMVRARNIVVSIEENIATVDAEILCMSSGSSKSTDASEEKFVRAERKAYKAEDGSIRVEEIDYYSSAEGEIKGASKETKISYENCLLTLENVDGKWYITTLVLDY